MIDLASSLVSGQSEQQVVDDLTTVTVDGLLTSKG